jgi:RNAse (barnase) inhibitor barstar
MAMTADVPFSFNAKELKLDATIDFVATVPPGLSDRESLFRALSRELQCPSYFGHNWDALSDCLRDLSWIKRRRVAILHSDLPSLAAREVLIYLDVLAQAVRDWKPEEDHELAVVFPPESRDTVTKAIKDNKQS